MRGWTIKIGVMIPTYNEEGNIRRCLEGLLQQTLEPTRIVIHDQNSTDDTKRIASKFLENSDIPFRILTGERNPLLGKMNINRAYKRASRFLPDDLDLVSCLEADVILGRKYYESISREFDDSKLGIACGRLDPHGFPDSFPLPETYKMAWGANRVYRYSCWRDLIGTVDLSSLSPWDVEHNVLASLKGWKVKHVAEAESEHLRPVQTYRGLIKGIKYRRMGYPGWWVLYKGLKEADPRLFGGFVCAALWGVSLSPLSTVYRRAFKSELKRTMREMLSFEQ